MLISQLLDFYSYIVLASMVFTWLPVNDTTRSLARPVNALTEPLLRPLRKALPQGDAWAPMAPPVLYFGLVVLSGLIPF
jgi:uncharacterized protein YggT (Ycf19 family)